jgi:hypothetical protein
MRNIVIILKEIKLRKCRDATISFEELIVNENWFSSVCNRVHNCQNDDFETIKKKKRTLFRRRKFDVLIEFI